MPCPDLGTLRASLDDAPDHTAAALHDHVLGCASCGDTLTDLRRNAELAAPAIALTGPDNPLPPAAVQAAFERLEQRRARRLAAQSAVTTGAVRPAGDASPAVTAPPSPAVPLVRLSRRARAMAAALVAAVVLAGLIATPGGRAAAAGFLAEFRSQRFAVVSLDRSQLMQLNAAVAQLVETGVFRADGGLLYGIAEPTPAHDLTEASRIAGFEVQPVTPSALPRGVAATPERILASGPQTVRITFDRAKALAYFQRNGQPQVKIPERFDGAQLIVKVPAIVVQEYAGGDGAPRLLVGKAGTIGLDAHGGASLAELRDLVLRLPGLPRATVAQLRAISDWRTTLPLPVPVDQARWRRATVHGAEALGFTDPSGKLHALLWQRGGQIWGVAGAISSREALDVAGSLG
jgi:hypothetical protein